MEVLLRVVGFLVAVPIVVVGIGHLASITQVTQRVRLSIPRRGLWLMTGSGLLVLSWSVGLISLTALGATVALAGFLWAGALSQGKPKGVPQFIAALPGLVVLGFGVWIMAQGNPPTTSESAATTPPVTTAPEDQEMQTRTGTTTSSSAQESISPTDYITTEVQFQDVFPDMGQKVVVYIKNNHKTHAFDGRVRVNILNDQGREVGSELFFVTLAPEGQQSGILWAKPGGTKFNYKPSGQFKEVPAAANQKTSDYEVVGKRTGLNYITFYVVVPDMSKDRLMRISRTFQQSYTKDLLFGFQVFFFPASKADEARKEDPDIDLAEANFAVNYNTGLSELIIYATHEKINVQ